MRPGQLLIKTHLSLVSAGTERMLVEFGQANLLNKARQQPEKVLQVINKAKTDGIMATLETVRSKLDQPLPLGYCNVGEVIAIGDEVRNFSIGDRVISNGWHAEFVSVPQHLCAKIPTHVEDDLAVFTIIGAIALEGIRLAQPTIGETFVVIGLGLIGLMTAQILLANGCQVIGIDFSADKLQLAHQLGIKTYDLSSGHDPVALTMQCTENLGVDGVLITANTQSNEPIRQAAQMCRQRGRIILVGVSGLELSRADFYAKELSFQVSCSYGPGRYDRHYEEKGLDYPFGLVRWTEQRNFSAILALMSAGKINTKAFITHRYQIENAKQAYEALTNDPSTIGILLQYPHLDCSKKNISTLTTVHYSPINKFQNSPVTIGFLGAGNYATRVLIPAFKNTSAKLDTVVTARGFSAQYTAKKFGFSTASTETDSIFKNPQINTLVIATQHHAHAEHICLGLSAGKHIFVEKPLAITDEQLNQIKTAYDNNPSQLLMVGFNRRFSPLVKKMRELLQTVNQPKALVMTVNSGYIPADHWTQDVNLGGGRMIGEGCHFIDLLRFLTGHIIVNFKVTALSNKSLDNFSVTLQFADGSIGALHYFANGHPRFSKERLEVFCGGKILVLDNFRKLYGYGWKSFGSMKLWRQDKGQTQCTQAFVNAIAQGHSSPIDFNELMEVSQVTIDIGEQIYKHV